MMTLKSRVNTPEFDAAFDAIFGVDRKVERGSWVQDPNTGKLVPKSEFQKVDPDAPAVHAGMEEFKSPIDGSIISDRGALRRHNQRNGVTNINDYGDNNGQAYFERKARERQAVINGTTREAKRERVETIKQAMARHGLSN